MFDALTRALRQILARRMQDDPAAAQREARSMLQVAIKRDNCALALLRLAMHDCLTFDEATRTGGANASIRMPQELEHRGNDGLQAALDVLQPINECVPGLNIAGMMRSAASDFSFGSTFTPPHAWGHKRLANIMHWVTNVWPA
jgi:Peroxidase